MVIPRKHHKSRIWKHCKMPHTPLPSRKKADSTSLVEETRLIFFLFFLLSAFYVLCPILFNDIPQTLFHSSAAKSSVCETGFDIQFINSINENVLLM